MENLQKFRELPTPFANEIVERLEYLDKVSREDGDQGIRIESLNGFYTFLQIVPLGEMPSLVLSYDGDIRAEGSTLWVFINETEWKVVYIDQETKKLSPIRIKLS